MNCGVKLSFVGLFLLAMELCLPGLAASRSNESLYYNNLLSDIKTAVQTRNYKLLKQYIKGDQLSWSYGCYFIGDAAEDNSFREIEKKLLSQSKDAAIIVEDRVIKNDDAPLRTWEIKTEGWIGEDPFIHFIFVAEPNRFEWVGICSDSIPDPRGPFKKPIQLPRPGPRVFQEHLSLFARLAELLRLQAFDALEPYAIRRKLFFSECGGMKREVPIKDVIDFLKNNSTKSNEIKFYLYGDLQTEGWGGKYPFISFDTIKNGETWEWSGITYCKNRPGKHPAKINYRRF